jgi:hypothetical protein
VPDNRNLELDGGRGPGNRELAFTEAEVNTVLSAVALSSGSAAKAKRLLEAAGHRAPRRETISHWMRHSHAEEYARIRHEVQPRINAMLTESLDGLVREYLRLQYEAAAKVGERLEEVTKSTDAAKIARDLAVAAGIAQDKARLRRGEPTEIRRVGSVADIFKALAQKYPGLVKRVDAEGQLVEVEEVTEPRKAS